MVAAALSVMAVALLVDTLIGDPSWLYRRVPHPVTLMGRAIGAADTGCNRLDMSPCRRRAAGVAVLAVLAAATAAAAFAVHHLLAGVRWGWLVEGVLASALLAQHSLYRHVGAVERALRRDGLPAGRVAVGMIVGRDVSVLGAAGVRRAAIESLAENLSDGVVAPLFWGCLLGLPGIAVYKLVNTADSMIGHRTPRHGAFGWAAARLDDVLNLAPARLTGLLIGLCARSRRSLRVMLRDARAHRSPNAGWPEAAMAGALGIRLSGPRRYGTSLAAEPWLGGEGRDPDGADIPRALAIMARVYVALLILVGSLAIILSA
jgi:adenosylcobinamide-phosphate synthase